MQWLRALPAALWAVVIFTLSSLPRLPPGPFEIPGFDKMAHASVYGVLAVLLLIPLRGSLWRRAYIAVLLAALYGVSDEVHQMFVPGRSPDVLDWCADVFGAVSATFVWWRWQRMRGAAADRNQRI